MGTCGQRSRSQLIISPYYLLDKSNAFPYALLMCRNRHFLLDLPETAAFRIVSRKSLLMDASNFRVGIFSSSFRLAFSMRGVL